MATPTEWEWRAYAAIGSAHARLTTLTETSLDNVLGGNLGWAAQVGVDEIRLEQYGGGGANANSGAHTALAQAKALLMAIEALAGRVKDVHEDDREELANSVCLLADLLDELADSEAPARWAAYRERQQARLEAQRGAA